jgi:hypothetical protein
LVIKSFSYRIFCVSFFIISCLLFACAPFRETVQRQPEILDPMQQLEQKLESMRKSYNIPGMSVAILKEQEVVFNRGFL